MSIVNANINTSLLVEGLLGDDKTKKHMESLGITPGQKIIVISMEKEGLIIKVKDSRLAIDRLTASRILVYDSASVVTLEQSQMGGLSSKRLLFALKKEEKAK